LTWNVEFLPEADKDLDDLSQSNQLIVKKAIRKVQQNPLPCSLPENPVNIFVELPWLKKAS